ncbi:ead/Ea22-like family protein [Salmonella enterica]|nr:ead/Ea22-like family protein [Salmonella enterica]EKR0892703.1 ead/Ea22-like family protein [Salmonella enterica]
MNIDKQAIDFSQPLETESGEPVKYICHDVIEYKCARVCVDIATGIVYSSPYVGLKIRNKEANPRSKLREQIESAADAYWQFDNGWISDMKCGDLSHEYLLFAKEPKNVLALLDENIQLQREKDATEAVALALRDDMRDAREKLEAAERRIAELEARKVNLSKLSVGEVMYVSGFSRDYAEGWCAGNDNAIHEIRTAGIKVKGE